MEELELNFSYETFRRYKTKYKEFFIRTNQSGNNRKIKKNI